MNSKKGRCRASMNYDNVHEKCPKKPCTRFCTRFCGANMALCGTIKHHGQCDIQAFTALWSVMALYKTGGYASSLSAKPADYFSGFLFFKKFSISISVCFIIFARCLSRRACCQRLNVSPLGERLTIQRKALIISRFCVASLNSRSPWPKLR